MSHVGWVMVLLALVLQGDPVAAEALKGFKHPWADFTEGASVTLRETFQKPDIDGAGKLVYQRVTNEITWSVALIEGEKTTLRVEGDGQESAIPFFMGYPAWARGSGEKKGTEEVMIGDKKLMGEVTVIRLDAGKDASQVTTIVKSAELPDYWALRRRVETLMQGKLNTSEDERVVELGAKVKVGDRDLSCVLVEVTVEALGYAKTVRKEWRTDEVPGRVAKREVRQYTSAGKEVDGASSEMAVVRFKAKR